MATAVGYDCEFVRPPPDKVETHCPICLLIVREPHQVKCCGKIYCKTCITEALEGGKPCPTCKTERPQHWPDKNRKQTLCGLRVFCPHRAKDVDGNGRMRRVKKPPGCDWKGELGSLDKHLNESPRLEELFKGCQYISLDCSLCREPIQRHKLQAHRQNECPERPYKCRYCSYKDSYNSVTKEHSPSCPKEPVPCQHCNKIFERQELENHVAKECEIVCVLCDFNIVGCEVELTRKDMASHLKEAIESHVALLHDYLKSCPRLTRECLPLFASCLEQLVSEKQQLRHDVEKLSDLKTSLNELTARLVVWQIQSQRSEVAQAVTNRKLEEDIVHSRQFACYLWHQEQDKRQEFEKSIQAQGIVLAVIVVVACAVLSFVICKEYVKFNSK